MSVDKKRSKEICLFGQKISIERVKHGFVRMGKEQSALRNSRQGYIGIADSWYFMLLDSTWGRLMTIVILFYIFSCLIFTFVAMPFTDAILNASSVRNEDQSDFLVALVFSVTHVVTMGYGQFYPYNIKEQKPDLGLFFLASSQQLLGIIINVLVFTMVITKIQHPTPAIVFSQNALITTRNRQKVLLIRIGNLRCNHIYMPCFRVSVLHHEKTVEGETYMKWLPLQVTEIPMMTAVAIIEHVIDENSPINGISEQYLQTLNTNHDFALSVTLMGKDAVYHDDVSAACKFYRDDVVFGALRFDDVMELRTVYNSHMPLIMPFVSGRQQVRVNFEKLSDLVAIEKDIDEAIDPEGGVLLDRIHGDGSEDNSGGEVNHTYFECQAGSGQQQPGGGNYTNLLNKLQPSNLFPPQQHYNTSLLSTRAPSSSLELLDQYSRGSPNQQLTYLSGMMMGMLDIDEGFGAVGPDIVAGKDTPLEHVISSKTSKEDPNILYLFVGSNRRRSEADSAANPHLLAPFGGLNLKLCSFSCIVECLIKAARIPHRIVAIDTTDKPPWFTEPPFAAGGTTPCIWYKDKFQGETADILKLIVQDFGKSHLEKYLELPPGLTSSSSVETGDGEAAAEKKEGAANKEQKADTKGAKEDPFSRFSGAKVTGVDFYGFPGAWLMSHIMCVVKAFQTVQLQEMEAEDSINAAAIKTAEKVGDEKKSADNQAEDKTADTKEKTEREKTLEKLRKAKEELPASQEKLETMWRELDELYKNKKGTIYLYGSKPSLDDIIFLTSVAMIRGFYMLMWPQDKCPWPSTAPKEPLSWDPAALLGFKSICKSVERFRSTALYRAARPCPRSEVNATILLADKFGKMFGLKIERHPVISQLEKSTVEYCEFLQNEIVLPALITFKRNKSREYLESLTQKPSGSSREAANSTSSDHVSTSLMKVLDYNEPDDSLVPGGIKTYEQSSTRGAGKISAADFLSLDHADKNLLVQHNEQIISREVLRLAAGLANLFETHCRSNDNQFVPAKFVREIGLVSTSLPFRGAGSSSSEEMTHLHPANNSCLSPCFAATTLSSAHQMKLMENNGASPPELYASSPENDIKAIDHDAALQLKLAALEEKITQRVRAEQQQIFASSQQQQYPPKYQYPQHEHHDPSILDPSNDDDWHVSVQSDRRFLSRMGSKSSVNSVPQRRSSHPGAAYEVQNITSGSNMVRGAPSKGSVNSITRSGINQMPATGQQVKRSSSIINASSGGGQVEGGPPRRNSMASANLCL